MSISDSPSGDSPDGAWLRMQSGIWFIGGDSQIMLGMQATARKNSRVERGAPAAVRRGFLIDFSSLSYALKKKETS